MSKKITDIQNKLKLIKNTLKADLESYELKSQIQPQAQSVKAHPFGQPTDEEMIAHLKKTNSELVDLEKTLKNREDKWNGGFNNFFSEVQKPVESQELVKKDWGRGPIEDEVMTEEERRISSIPVNPALLQGD